jgi:uncharacterized protein YdeI (YjbR/CyaY-like superfamily)
MEKKKALSVPADLRAAISRNKTAAEAFRNFSYSHRKEYVKWVLEAKRPETRARRIAETVERLSKAKS